MTRTAAPRLWTVEEFQAAAEQGLVPERSQLVDGQVWEHVTTGRRHIEAVQALVLSLLGVPAPLELYVQQPLRCGTHQQPELDVGLLRSSWRRRPGVPHAEDALLVVEVADSSVRRDREQKVPLYAEAAVPEMWLVDLVDGVVVRHREPSGRRWLTVDEYRDGLLAPRVAPDHPVDVAALLQP